MESLPQLQARLAQLQKLQQDAQHLIQQSEEFLDKVAEVQEMEKDLAAIV